MNEQTASVSQPVGTITAPYILYLAGFLTGGLTTLIGIIWAYLTPDTLPGWQSSHRLNAIHIFWKSLAYFLIGIITTPVLIGFVILLALPVWFIIRCVKGLQLASRQEVYPNPESWTL